MMDLARELIAAQTHRRTIDPMSFRRWGRPFVIERVSADASITATGPSAQAGVSKGQGNSQ